MSLTIVEEVACIYYLSFFNQTQQLTNQLSALALQFSTDLSVIFIKHSLWKNSVKIGRESKQNNAKK
ncbi:unnamed protein product [Trifolium pratense]|uniref:Uncharacterized protein n=1 Tax=Trifolium pratense TaxID=57577 RepID=A0ACB0K127_TRIPR|nr:unnamed protein product [Trifolium pratense]